jgi:CorA-like Mg2+ transporter protein
MVTPVVDWSDVDGVLIALEVLPQPVGEVDHESEPHERLLALLPHLYALGVARIRREVFPRDDLQQSAKSGPLFFPTVGFEPVAPEDAAHANGAKPTATERLAGFWTIRTCVGVIGDRTVVTIRLPDLLCTGTPESEPAYRTPLERDLPIPRRFLAGRFPRLSRGPEAVDIAEGIAMHHAATARAVAEKARKALRAAESSAGHMVVDGEQSEASGSQRADALRELERISEITQQIDRQLSRELRRLTDYGDCQHPVGTQADVRFGFALDEIRSLRTELSTTRAAIVGHIQVQDQNERERFQFVVALLGSAILIPTLVAAIYGANVNVPGENSWTGFRALLLFILAFFIIGVLAVNQFWASGWAPRRNWLQKRWIKVAALGVAAISMTLAIIAAVP